MKIGIYKRSVPPAGNPSTSRITNHLSRKYIHTYIVYTFYYIILLYKRYAYTSYLYVCIEICNVTKLNFPFLYL